MDKLKQVLQYRFWILLGLAIVFPLVGWFLASSGMAKGYEEREKKLNGRFGELKASAADPNNDWESNLKKVNEVQELEARTAWVRLWEAQQELKVWPPRMSTTEPEKFTLADQGYYKKNYLTLREEVFNQLQPVVEDEDEGKRIGKVAASLEAFPFSEPVGAPRVDNPSSQEIEEAQEDLWLSAALIQVVNYLNRESTSQLDAVVPEIRVFELRGGNKGGAAPAAKKASSGGSGGGGGAAAMGEQMAAMAKDALKASGFGNKAGGTGGSADGGATSTVGTIPVVTFNPVDELGDPGEPKRRYVEEKEEWKTRGFYLELKINQSRLPELLVTLSNLNWPARVARVQIADVREEELISADGSALPMAGGGGAGAGMGAGMGMGMGMGGAGGPGGGMKAMSEAMSKMGKGGMGGAGMAGAGMAGAGMAGAGKAAGAKSSVPGGLAAGGAGGGAIAASLDGTGLGATGESGLSTVGKVDPLANPNLVDVAIDGWFVIFKKPKPEILAKVYPPAPTADPAAPAGGTPANATTTGGANPAGSSPVTGTAATGNTPPAETAADTPPAADAGTPAEEPATDAAATAEPAEPAADESAPPQPDATAPTEPAAGGTEATPPQQ